MSSSRSMELQELVECLKASFAASHASPAARAFAGELFIALQTPAAAGKTPPSQLPVCDHLPATLQTVRAASPDLENLAEAFEKIAPYLSWKVRPSGGPQASKNWPEGHANATIIGAGGLEERNDVAIGASLLAPNVRYPDHSHPPEELYLVLTPGRFQHGEEAWCEPGPSGTFHNAPNIKHAMASADGPLLAIWTLISR